MVVVEKRRCWFSVEAAVIEIMKCALFDDRSGVVDAKVASSVQAGVV